VIVGGSAALAAIALIFRPKIGAAYCVVAGLLAIGLELVEIVVSVSLWKSQQNPGGFQAQQSYGRFATVWRPVSDGSERGAREPSPRGGGADHAFNASQSSLRDLLQAP
jgi:hypothetical protein